MSLTTLIPNNYQKNNKSYYYKVADGIPFNFFINSAPISYDFDDLILSIFDGYNTEVLNDVAPLSQVMLEGGTYRIYCEDVIIEGLKNGVTYQPRIYNSVTNEELYRGSCFQFVLDPEPYTMLSYRNSTNIFNYNYQELPDYRNIILVDLNQIDNVPEYDLNQYSEASTGYIRNQKSQLKDSITLESYFFDPQAHSAMKAISMHDDILINFEAYQVKEGYKIETNIRSKRTKGKIEMYIQGNNEINLNG